MWLFSRKKKVDEWIETAKRCRELQDFDGCLTAINAARPSDQARVYYALLLDTDAEFRSFVSDIQNGVKALEFCSGIHGEIKRGVTPKLLVVRAKDKLSKPCSLPTKPQDVATGVAKPARVKKSGGGGQGQVVAWLKQDVHFSDLFWPLLGWLALLPAGLVNYACWQKGGAGLKTLAAAVAIGSIVAAVEYSKKDEELILGRHLYLVLSLGMATLGFVYEGYRQQIFCLYFIATAAFSAVRGAMTDDEDRLVLFSVYSDVLTLLGVFITGHWFAGALMAVLGLIRLAKVSDAGRWARGAASLIYIAAGILAWQGCFFWMLGCCVAILGIIVHES